MLAALHSASSSTSGATPALALSILTSSNTLFANSLYVTVLTLALARRLSSSMTLALSPEDESSEFSTESDEPPLSSDSEP